MLKKKISLKLFAILIASILLSTFITMLLMYQSQKRLITNALANHAQAAMNTLQTTVEELKNSSMESVVALAGNSDVIHAVERGNKRMVTASVNFASQVTMNDMDFVTITDANGIVIARTHSDLSGDSIVNQYNVQSALDGKALSFVGQGTEIKLAIRSSCPVYGPEGQIVGVISAGYSLDKNDFVDRVKKLSGTDTSIFLNNMRISTTIEEDGVRQIGTELDEKIAAIVLEQGQQYLEESTIFNSHYYTNYVPIIDHTNTVIGIYFTGLPIDSISTQITRTTAFTLVVILLLIVVLIAVMSFIIRKIILYPVNEILHATNRLTAGDISSIAFTTNSEDEIGQLSNSIQNMAMTLKNLMQDLSLFLQKHAAGDIDAVLDDTQYLGVFAQVIQEINGITRNYVAEEKMLLECFEKISDGDFDVTLPQLPGKKAKINEGVDAVTKRLNGIMSQINTLLENALVGDLSQKSADSQFKGQWHDILSQLNLLLEAIAVPINESVPVLEQMAQGKFDNLIEGQYSGVFAVIKNSVNDSSKALMYYAQSIKDVLANMANDDLSHSMDEPFKGEFDAIRGSINILIDTFNKFIIEVNMAAKQLTVGASLVSSSSQTIAQNATEQAQTIQTLRQGIENIDSHVKQNAQDAVFAKDLAIATRDSAKVGGEQMEEMVASMNAIFEASNNISGIMDTMKDIAFQTNLLALNASVESARAGVHGKGFAVVADEVRNLAVRSQNSANDSTELLDDTMQKIDNGIKVVKRVSDTFKEILEDINKISGNVDKIASDTLVQANEVESINSGIADISSVSVGNTATSEEMASAAQELNSQAEVLQQLTGKFRVRE